MEQKPENSEALEMSCEAAMDMVEDLIGYRPKTGCVLWLVVGMLREKQAQEGGDWTVVDNACGWFQIVRPEDMPVLLAWGYQPVSDEALAENELIRQVETADEANGMTREAACQIIEDLLGYRPETERKLWPMYDRLKEKREKEGPDWHLVWNNRGWFHLVRTVDMPVLEQHGYGEVAIETPS